MDYLVFIFKGSVSHYIVVGENEDDAWDSLCKRQSCRLEIAKKRYKLIHIMNAYSPIYKIKG